MTDVSYVSKVRIERLGGPQRLAYLPAEGQPVVFGVHSEVAQHYGVRPEQYPPHATTLDYVVAAAGGWLAGTFAGALEARHIEVDPKHYEVEAIGEIETEDGVLVIKRITVNYRMAVAPDRRSDAERVHGFHARFCPVARSLAGAIEITTQLELRWTPSHSAEPLASLQLRQDEPLAILRSW
jgi:uncharacterized OsmC-like protein